MNIYLFYLLLLPNLHHLVTAAEADACDVSVCRHGEPPVRFPFWIKGHQPQHCGYPGFQLFCSEKKLTMIELPSRVRLQVKQINYTGQWIHFNDPEGCLSRQLPNLNISTTPFQFSVDYYYLLNYSLFNCSQNKGMDYEGTGKIDCLSTNRYNILAVADGEGSLRDMLLNCRRVTQMFSIQLEIMSQFRKGLYLSWSEQLCQQCEAMKQKCRLRSSNGGTEGGTECFGSLRHSTGTSVKLIATAISLGSLLLASATIALCYLHHLQRKKEEAEQTLQNFLEDYRTLKPSRYSYADIKRITYNFEEKVGQGGYGTVYKGRLSNDVLVAVKVLNNHTVKGDEFINEVGSMFRVHHINVARMAGFCADGYHQALIYEYLPNESLEKFIFTGKGENDRLLSWEKLHEIALGIARGIEYLHQGCEQRILHFDIKPQNILLDENFNPKISDFGLAKLCSKEQSAVSMTAARGTIGYIAPEVLSRNFGNVSYKSDVYSYGMLLLEMVGGRKNIDVAVERSSQVNFPEWVYDHIDKNKDLGIIIEDEQHVKIAKKLTIAGLWCIQWNPIDRPSMKVVIQMLEGEASGLTMPPNPFPSPDAMRMTAQLTKEPVDGGKLCKSFLSRSEADLKL